MDCFVQVSFGGDDDVISMRKAVLLNSYDYGRFSGWALKRKEDAKAISYGDTEIPLATSDHMGTIAKIVELRERNGDGGRKKFMGLMRQTFKGKGELDAATEVLKQFNAFLQLTASLEAFATIQVA